MSVLKVLHVPDPRLRRIAKPIDKVDADVARLMDDMLETMYVNDGVGLAAPQLGIDQRILVGDYSETNQPDLIKMANPQILWASEDSKLMPEGCLSVPGQFAEISRSLSIKFSYLNEYNERIERDASGTLAHLIQHEMDHLNGILFIDHLSTLKRNILLRKALKVSKSMT